MSSRIDYLHLIDKIVEGLENRSSYPSKSQADQIALLAADLAEGTFQPAPTRVAGAAVWELVMADFAQRNEIGIEKYGTPLKAFDGRNSLQDLYEERLDEIVYLKKYIEEQNGKT